MGSPDNDYAGTVMNMALIKKRLGKLEEAEKLYYQGYYLFYFILI